MGRLKHMSERAKRIEARKKGLFEFLRRFDYKEWVATDFGRILDDAIITNTLNVANIETAERKFLNRHGVEHGLKVADNAAHLFWLIHHDYIGSDYAEEYEFSKEEVLFTLLTAGYIHDCGRFFDEEIKNHEEKVGEAIRHLSFIARDKTILGKVVGEHQDFILAKIEELCMCHNKKYSPSGKVEIAIIKLADALDCDKNRLYDETEKPNLADLGKEDYAEKTRIIVFNDAKPEKYFGPESIETVELNPKESEGLIEVSFRIRNPAAYGEIKSAVEILKNSRSSQAKTVRDFQNRVRVLIHDLQHPRPFFLYPMNPVYLPGACMLCTGYKIDILDMDGTARIELPLIIQNKNNSGGLSSHVCMLGGFEKVDWGDIETKDFFKVTKDFKDVSEIKETDKIPLDPPEYMYSRKKGINHYFNVIFPEKIKVGEVINLLGVFKWRKFFNVHDDKMNHIIATSTNNLFFDIRFPKDVPLRAKVESSFEIIREPEILVYREKVEPEVDEDRIRLKKLVNSPHGRGTRYVVRWKF